MSARPVLTDALQAAWGHGRTPQARLRASQDAALRRLLLHAYDTVRYYRRLFDRHRLLPRHLRGVVDLDLIPTSGRDDLAGEDRSCLLARGTDRSTLVPVRPEDPVAAIKRLTGGRGVDVAIEALGTQNTFESALRVLRPGGTLSSLGVYSGDLKIPLGAFAAGLGDLKIVTTLCPGGKERMRRLMDVVSSGRADLKPLVTHRFKLDEIEAAYDLFANQRDGVLKVAITP